jgi:hypothetical protein
VTNRVHLGIEVWILSLSSVLGRQRHTFRACTKSLIERQCWVNVLLGEDVDAMQKLVEVMVAGRGWWEWCIPPLSVPGDQTRS